MFKKKSILIYAFLWFMFICFGFIKIYNYMGKPGEAGNPPMKYPSSVINEIGNKPKILFFAHPKCPCSKAGIAELAKLLGRLDGRVDVDIIFHHPQERSIEWVKSSLWEKAKKLKNVKIMIDSDGKYVELFKPKTSGQVYLYNHTSKDLIYSGGITSSRGHEGDNTGSNVILDWVLHKKITNKVFAVFGCNLFHNGSEY